MANANLILGDCIEKMKELPANSIDAIITDPPYGLEFMGKDWDKFGEAKPNSLARCDGGKGRVNAYTEKNFNILPVFRGQTKEDLLTFQEFNHKWATEALRVLKSGGFMFAMGGTRTHHRLTCGIEDAGFLIRDELCWVYMQGFPKAQDLAMLISKREGAVREGAVREGAGSTNTESLGEYSHNYQEMTLTENGKQWQGWKTPALKPAFEPIVVAQKPVEGSITENVMKYGVGGFNIDECRIPFENMADHVAAAAAARAHQQERCNTDGHNTVVLTPNGDSRLGNDPQEEYDRFMEFKGRYPSNLLMQEECFGKLSKYFLIPKASKGEKEENLEDMNERASELNSGGIGRKCSVEKRLEKYGQNTPTSKNFHPTVKPVALMQHLIKLTTKPLYTVLDPFLGSGTTAVAALQLNRNVIGIEMNEEYLKIAKARIAEEVKQTRLF